MWAALSPLVLWLAAIAAYAYEDGMNLFQWMGRFSQVLERPFAIGWTPYTLKYMLVGLLLYGCGIALYYSSRENRRPGEEYGSAKWGSPKELNRKYMDHQRKDANIILTQRVRLGMDGYITQRNMNVLVVGGSGSGKTRFFCKPNIYSANCSYLITDPKGELLRAAGALLAAQGYEVRVFNLIDPSQSDGYNPFSYIHSEKDVLTLIDNLIKNTTPRNASSNDPFWEKAEIALDSALMLYLVSEAPPEEQNFEMLIYMMNFAEVREEDDQYRSPLDMLFRALEEEQPNHVAVKQFKAFKQAAGKTAKSILVSAAVRLATFNIPQYARMTMVDEMDFGSLGEKKKAIFCVIPVDDSSMNYLCGNALHPMLSGALPQGGRDAQRASACAGACHSGRMGECGPAGELSEDPCHLPQLQYWAEHHRAEHSADQGAVRKGMGEHHRQLRHAALPRRRQRADFVGIYREAAGQGDHRHPHTGADEGSQRLQLYQLPTDGPRPDDH